MHSARCAALVALLLPAAGCAARSTPSAAPVTLPPSDTAAAATSLPRTLPPVPLVRGPLTIRVVYPRADAVVHGRDSSFLFGSVGTGEARLTIDGRPVRVWPNGAWLAWVPLGQDSARAFRLDAWTRQDSLTLVHVVRRGGWRAPPPAGLWIDSTSLAPVGPVWWPRDEYLTLRARAAEGAMLRLRLSDGTTVPLTPTREEEAVDPAVRAFDRDTANLITRPAREQYVGLLRGREVGPHPGDLFAPPSSTLIAVAAPLPPVRCASTAGCASRRDSAAVDSLWPVLEAVRGSDTVRTAWPLQVALLDTVPLVAQLDDDTAGTGATDRLTVGRALPGGTYHWFFPTGTRAPVSGRMGEDVRLELAPGVETWVARTEALPAAAAPGGPAVVGSMTLSPAADRVLARVPLSRRIPFQVLEEERALVLRIYDAVGDVNWIRYGPGDSLVRQVHWAQEAARQVTLTFELAKLVWGYRARWERNDLVFEIRRPPAIDEGHPLRGRHIAVDPGHPPAGATGPTGLREAEANLGVALELRRRLEAAGARVLMTRTADVSLDLWPRLAAAEAAGAEVLVSVHNNALPDGLNPFTNSGSSVYYNHPRGVPLARAIQQELVRHLGLRDLGIGRGDLALVRATWMPSVLTEGMFMMLPEQEAALRSTEGQRLYAAAIFEGLRRYFRDAAREE
jgi:N-acetylmuramoyl-L-alanine amidase